MMTTTSPLSTPMTYPITRWRQRHQHQPLLLPPHQHDNGKHWDRQWQRQSGEPQVRQWSDGDDLPGQPMPLQGQMTAMAMAIWAAKGQMVTKTTMTTFPGSQCCHRDRWQWRQRRYWAANAATGTDDNDNDYLDSQGSDSNEDDIPRQPMPPQGQMMTMMEMTTWAAKGQMAMKTVWWQQHSRAANATTGPDNDVASQSVPPQGQTVMMISSSSPTLSDTSTTNHDDDTMCHHCHSSTAHHHQHDDDDDNYWPMPTIPLV